MLPRLAADEAFKAKDAAEPPKRRSLECRLQNSQQIPLCRHPWIDIAEAFDREGLGGKGGELLTRAAEIANPLGDADLLAEAFDSGYGPLGGFLFIAAASVFA